MEEKNQDTQDTNQYTGEYGNPMEKSEDTVKPAGEEQSSSVYSYSYRDHKPEATSSGDYHASENASSAGLESITLVFSALQNGHFIISPPIILLLFSQDTHLPESHPVQHSQYIQTV